ncbi:MAG: ABC transporter substrate binding protein [Desulfobacteraceae bacterium]
MLNTISRFLFVVSMVFGLVLSAQAAKRVLYIDSYHQGFPWSDGITEAVQSVMAGQDVTLKIIRLDTKNHPDEAYKKQVALKAKATIEAFRPDVVIASDDNASKYIIVPYYKDARLPFVFCGVNYTAEPYGFPFSNVTGMVELPPAIKLIYSLKHFSRITKVGYLAADTLTERKDGQFTKRDVREDFVERYVSTFSQWQREFIKLQDEVDALIIGNNGGIKGWDDDEATRFAEQNTRIVTGCLLDWIAPYAFLGATRSATEQGTYAAQTALEILNGTPPSSIPIRGNVQANIIINMKIAKKLNKKIPASFMKIATHVIK